ncbi:MAG: hypothetical protein ACE5IB_05220 [Candidatus Geothermarchaeales archaeon]
MLDREATVSLSATGLLVLLAVSLLPLQAQGAGAPSWFSGGAYAKYAFGGCSSHGWELFVNATFYHLGGPPYEVRAQACYGRYEWMVEEVEGKIAHVAVHLEGVRLLDQRVPYERRVINATTHVDVDLETLELVEEGRVWGRWPFLVKPGELDDGPVTVATNWINGINITLRDLHSPQWALGPPPPEPTPPYDLTKDSGYLYVGSTEVDVDISLPGFHMVGDLPFSYWYEIRTLLFARSTSYVDDILYHNFGIYDLTQKVRFEGKQYLATMLLIETNAFLRMGIGDSSDEEPPPGDGGEPPPDGDGQPPPEGDDGLPPVDNGEQPPPDDSQNGAQPSEPDGGDGVEEGGGPGVTWLVFGLVGALLGVSLAATYTLRRRIRDF